MRLGSRCFSKGGFDQNQQFVILFVVRKACVWVGYGCLQFSYSWLSLLMWHTVKLDYCCPDYCQLQPGQPCLLYSWLSLPWSYTVKLDYSCLDHCLQLTVYRQLVLPYVPCLVKEVKLFCIQLQIYTIGKHTSTL